MPLEDYEFNGEPPKGDAAKSGAQGAQSHAGGGADDEFDFGDDLDTGFSSEFSLEGMGGPAEAEDMESEEEKLQRLEREREGVATPRAARWVAGGFCGCVIFILLLVAGAYFTVNYYVERSDEFVFKYNLYKKIEKDHVVIEQSPKDNTLILAKSVVIDADCGVNLAIRADSCVINSSVNGKIVIIAKLLEVSNNAIIRHLQIESLDKLIKRGQIVEQTGKAREEFDD